MKKILLSLLAACLVFASAGVAAKDSPDEKRAHMDTVAKETLAALFKAEPVAKELYDKSYGYAVFDNTKVTFIISGGGGSGVAVDKSSGKRTYMNMGTGGLALGLGAQKYQVIFLFQTAHHFNSFVDKGWEADAGASAVAGEHGANLEATFVDGKAYYMMTEAGLMLSADIAGTKYWKSKKLN